MKSLNVYFFALVVDDCPFDFLIGVHVTCLKSGVQSLQDPPYIQLMPLVQVWVYWNDVGETIIWAKDRFQTR